MTDILWAHSFDGFSCGRSIDRVPIDNSKMHTHDRIEIYYFISGNCTYMIEGTAYPLKPHDILFKRPLEAHKLVVNASDVPYERIGVNVSPDLFRSLDPDNRLFEAMMARPLGTGNCFTASDFGHTVCTELMQQLAKRGGEMQRVEILSILMYLCAEAARVLRDNRSIKRASDVSTRLIDHVNEHLFEDISLEAVSRTFYMSQSQINRIFKTYTGSSMWQYISVKRLLTARDRIRSGLSATETCFACGYSDYSVFYRAYVKQFGCTPQEDKRYGC